MGNVYLNGDYTAANYRSIITYAQGANVGGTIGADEGARIYFPAANAPANSCCAGKLYIVNYAGTTFNKQINTRYVLREAAAETNEDLMIGGCEWENTAAVNQINVILSVGGNWVAGTTFRLYGIY
jgi:hypothetical protein